MSNNITHDERIRRQKLDNGDGDDRVYMVRSLSAKNVYHDEAECEYLRVKQPRTTTRKAAKRRWAAPCMECAVDEGGGT